MSGVLLAIFAYVLVQFAIGVYVSQKMSTAADYILAGRSLGVLLVAFSVFTSFFGAESLIATAGAVYSDGMAATLVEPFGYGAALIIAALIFAGPLWRRNVTTFADLFRQRYSEGIEKLVVIALLPGSVFWAAAQIRAFGVVLSANSTMEITTAILLAGLIIASYSVVGGLLADSITDVIQGAVLIVGLIILAVAILTVPAPTDALEAAKPAVAGVVKPVGWLTYVEKLAVPICGTIVSVELISRYLGARSANVAMLGTAIGGVIYIAVGLMPIFFGLSAQALLPGLAEPEQVVPKLAESFLPDVLRIVLVGAIVSAILSVTHAALHGASAQVSHNIVTPWMPDASALRRLWLARLTVMGLSIVAVALALTSERIKELVEYASSAGSAGVFVVAMFALFTRFGGRLAAFGAIAAGIVTWPLGRFVLAFEHPYTIALVVSLVLYVGLALAEPHLGKQPATPATPSPT